MKILLIIILLIDTCLFLYSNWKTRKKMYPFYWRYIKSGAAGILPIAVLALSGTFFTDSGALILIALLIIIEVFIYYRQRRKIE